MTRKSRVVLIFGLSLLALVVVFAVFVVQYLAGPMVKNGDLNQWVGQADYVARNLRLDPLPHLDLENDQLFYPYQGNNVFRPWVLEMHIFSAALTGLTGHWGPWDQLYYLLSLIVGAGLAFVILSREYSLERSAIAALVVSFCNFYAVAKYPYHMGISVVHWLVASLLVDHVLVRRVVLRRPVTAPFLTARVALLFLGLGLDLGYVCGIALTSFLVSMLFILLWILGRSRLRLRRLFSELRTVWEDLLSSALRRPKLTSVGIGVCLVASFLYLPLVLQIRSAALSFDFSDLNTGAWWSSPKRVLLPILPGWDQEEVNRGFDDSCEGVFDTSPGLFFVLTAALGLALSRKKLSTVIPPVAVLVLLLSYHPTEFAGLRALPWFGFARVSGRFSVAYPALLTIVALQIPRGWFRGKLRMAVAVALVSLACLETGAAYSAWMIRSKNLSPPSPDLLLLMDSIRHSPGEALMEWPFIITAGNGINSYWPCRPHALSGHSALVAFHGKKVMASGWGRLHPEQLQDHLRAGWPRLNTLPAFQSRPRGEAGFWEHEWVFLEQFFKLNDFCGILLYLDHIPPVVVDGFVERFGPIVKTAETPAFGRVAFIAKPASWRGLVNRQQGRSLELEKPVFLWPRGQSVAFNQEEVERFLDDGWSHEDQKGRWTDGPEADLRFRMQDLPADDAELVVVARAAGRQRIRVLLNGTVVAEQLWPRGKDRRVSVSLPAHALRLRNQLRFELPDARSPASIGKGGDQRLLGLHVSRMEIR